MKLNIVHLYPKEMNIYGDTGNVLVLKKRMQWRGIEPVIHLVGVGQDIPDNVDIIIGGGGQDSGQLLVVEDLKTKSKKLNAMADDGVVMLMICGMYQLFGHYFLTQDGKKLPGISIFDSVTRASETRLIGNIVSKTPFGDLVGYENHSGLTTLGSGVESLGKTSSGQGNNGKDKTEGALIQNVFGSYIHGPILAKNPNFADELISRAITRLTGTTSDLKQLNDQLEHSAARVAKSRPR